MNTPDVGDVYAKAAAAHGSATDQGDHERSNKAHDDVIRALEVLRASSDSGRAVLASLLDSKDNHVRCWAATHLLPLDEVTATRTLEELSTLPPFVGFNAKMVLREWQAGRLNIP